ncbi:Transposase, mutator type [Candidatus Omnitrophus magneticus]|uniref:Mutator family transposase n=1 Tax=Candidatus Omnitrophus magneticus TaxID=1609969 RepID=A0A0F0CUE3_9BACT|nr:Transposase, mutator type [Candidatus Omnitrophus magneticus]
MGTICDDLKKRGIKRVLLWVTDGVAGVGEEVQKRFSYTKIQLCIIHKIRNILEKVRKEDKAIILADFKQTFKLDNPNHTKEEAIKETETFVEKWSKKYPSMNRMFDKEISEKLFAFLEFPWQIRRMLYTTNWIENLNDSIKRTTKIRRSFPTEDST